MRRYDKNQGEGKEPELVIMPYLLENQKNNTYRKEDSGNKTVVVFFKAMPEGT